MNAEEASTVMTEAEVVSRGGCYRKLDRRIHAIEQRLEGSVQRRMPSRSAIQLKNNLRPRRTT